MSAISENIYYSKPTIETLEKGAKCVQSEQKSYQNDVHFKLPENTRKPQTLFIFLLKGAYALFIFLNFEVQKGNVLTEPRKHELTCLFNE